MTVVIHDEDSVLTTRRVLFSFSRELKQWRILRGIMPQLEVSAVN